MAEDLLVVLLHLNSGAEPEGEEAAVWSYRRDSTAHAVEVVEGRLEERMGEDDPEEERLFRDLWEDETQRELVVESLKADCRVRPGRPAG